MPRSESTASKDSGTGSAPTGPMPAPVTTSVYQPNSFSNRANWWCASASAWWV